MTYATLCDIKTEFLDIVFEGDTGVTPQTINKFLAQEGSFIHTYIGERYDTPVTSTEGKNVLKKIEIQLVAYRVDKIITLTNSNPIPKKGVIQFNNRESCYREALEYLKSIRDNIMNLPGTSELEPEAGLGSFHTESGNSDIVPLIEKESQQW